MVEGNDRNLVEKEETHFGSLQPSEIEHFLMIVFAAWSTGHRASACCSSKWNLGVGCQAPVSRKNEPQEPEPFV